jgi:predicted DNA-binding transcriptional regulator YafY
MSERLTNFKRLFKEKSLWHVSDIQNRLSIDRTKVYTLRDQLQQQDGIWLEENKFHPDVKRGYLRWPSDNNSHRIITLSPVEIETIKTAIERAKPLAPNVKRALKALTNSEPLKQQLEKPSILYTPLADEYPDIFDNVAKAILDRRVAQIKYLNAKGETKTYKFNSYVIIPSDVHLHLIGQSHNSIDAGFDTITPLRLDQIKEFKLLLEYFKKPTFDVVAYAANKFGAFTSEGESVTIKVAFSAEKAQYIRRTKRHPTQTVKENKDGSVVWSINVPLTDDLVYWIVSYGPHAKVLQPKELKKRVLEWAKGVLHANA